jgi:hypothetical protein
MDTFGIIMVSVAFGIYGTYIAFCVYDICSYRCNNIKLCCKKLYCCKSNLPLDHDIRTPLTTAHQEIILPTSVYGQEMSSI